MYIFILWQTLFNLFGSCDLDFRTLPTSVLGQTDSDKKLIIQNIDLFGEFPKILFSLLE